jgi:predicted DsbA family dithiol-disulfide isomerase
MLLSTETELIVARVFIQQQCAIQELEQLHLALQLLKDLCAIARSQALPRRGIALLSKDTITLRKSSSSLASSSGLRSENALFRGSIIFGTALMAAFRPAGVMRIRCRRASRASMEREISLSLTSESRMRVIFARLVPTRSLSSLGDAQPCSLAVNKQSTWKELSVRQIGPTCALADELGITIDWQALIVTPSKTPAAPPSGDDRGARHRRFRADYLDLDIARYAADRGLSISGLQRRPDSTLAAIGLLWAQRQGPSLARTYVERAFERYCQEAPDIEDERSIRALLTEIESPVSGFEAFLKGDGFTKLARIQLELRDMRVFEVPTYILNGDTFPGRQHLPLIRSRLPSRSELPPT